METGRVQPDLCFKISPSPLRSTDVSDATRDLESNVRVGGRGQQVQNFPSTVSRDASSEGPSGRAPDFKGVRMVAKRGD